MPTSKEYSTTQTTEEVIAKKSENTVLQRQEPAGDSEVPASKQKKPLRLRKKTPNQNRRNSECEEDV